MQPLPSPALFTGPSSIRAHSVAVRLHLRCAHWCRGQLARAKAMPAGKLRLHTPTVRAFGGRLGSFAALSCWRRHGPASLRSPSRILSWPPWPPIHPEPTSTFPSQAQRHPSLLRRRGLIAGTRERMKSGCFKEIAASPGREFRLQSGGRALDRPCGYDGTATEQSDRLHGRRGDSRHPPCRPACPPGGQELARRGSIRGPPCKFTSGRSAHRGSPFPASTSGP